MCADANAAQRHAAKQRWLDKNFKYRSEGTKYHNREVKGIIGNQRIARGYSRATSDSVMNAYTKLGESFKQTESLYKKLRHWIPLFLFCFGFPNKSNKFPDPG